MENRKCVYFVEGACEKKLIEAMKEKPSLIYPGQIKVHNVIKDKIVTLLNPLRALFSRTLNHNSVLAKEFIRT